MKEMLNSIEDTSSHINEDSMGQNKIHEYDKDDSYSLPEKIYKYKSLDNLDKEKLNQQYQLYLKLSSLFIPNDLFLREKAGVPLLSSWTLVHWTPFDLDVLKSIKQKWILSWEILWIPEDNETNYCADFFRIPSNMSIAEYKEWINTPIMKGSVRLQHPEKTKLSSNVTIIINTHNKTVAPLLEKDAYKKWSWMENIVTNLLNYDHLSAVLYWIPANFISWLIIPERILADNENIKSLQNIFWPDVLLFDRNWNKLLYG